MSSKNSYKTNAGPKNLSQFNHLETFTIVPNIVELPPKTGFSFKFKAYSVKVGKLFENFVLTTQIGSERKR